MADQREPATRRPRHPVPRLLGSVVVVWLSLAAPAILTSGAGGALGRVPLEAVAFLVAAWLLPARWKAVWVVVGGLGLAALLAVTVADFAVGQAFDRRARPSDLTYLDSGWGLLTESVGVAAGLGIVVAVIGALLLLMLTQVWSLRVLAGLAESRPTLAAVSVALLLAAWVNAPGGPAQPVAAGLVSDHLRHVRTDATNREPVPEPTRPSVAPAPDLVPLAGLQGHDVVVIVVESYGRTALQGRASPVVRPALADAERSLSDAGYRSRSAFLTSPTFGGLSWLAHATLQSGLWVDSQDLHDQLMAQPQHSTLTRTFRDAGWRTAAVAPSNTEDWPAASSFYGFEAIYDSRNLGYRGSPLGYARVPDQISLATFARRELAGSAAERRPVMAQIDLVSSHTPWAPLPALVDWSTATDPGTIVPKNTSLPSRGSVWSSPAGICDAYGQSIAYSISSIVSFAQAQHGDDLVIVVVGDHQPASVVSGENAGRDVPITILTRDAATLGHLDDWQWQPTLAPDPSAPVWRMDAFADRFVHAFSS